MRVLVVGGGGREHALVWRLLRSPSVTEVLCAPGNGGIAQLCRTVAVKADDVAGQVALAVAERVDLVVVGPEAPLVAGLADRLHESGIAVFGCSSAAAEIEGSKVFAKELMHKYRVPTAAFGAFTDTQAAAGWLATQPEARWVVKADGLAAGKGVTICSDRAEANAEVARLLDGALGSAGTRVVVEEFLVGREASLMAFVDGERVLPLAPAEDHKTVFDGDRGPMTGGMGVVSPTPVLSASEAARATREILEPTARALVAEGRPFRGLLFAGLMITASGPKALEFNCRFGDPETQVLMLRLDDDLGALLHGVASGNFPERVQFSPDAAVCVVMAAPGYPGSYPTGTPITGLDAAAQIEGAVVFHAGTQAQGGAIVTAGGRVLGVCARAPSLDAARAAAYAACARIHFDGAHYRKDIGAR